MSETADVKALERETAESRERLARTIDRLTSPETADAAKREVMGYVEMGKSELGDFVSSKKEEVTDYATKAKDELIEKVRDTAQHKVQTFTDDLKARAAANPLAVALIGAGIAWRLYKSPPVTTVLVGAGVALLFRGGPKGGAQEVHRDPYDEDRPDSYVPGGVAGLGYTSDGAQAPGIRERLSAGAARTGEVAHDLAGRARQIAADASDRIADAAGRAAGSLSGAAARASEAASEAAGSAADGAYGAAARASAGAGEAASRASEAADHLYDSAAERASEVAARASGIAGRAGETVSAGASEAAARAARLAREARGNSLVLGGLGIVGGIVIWRAIVATEAGHRAVDEGSRSLARRARGVTHAAGAAARRAASEVGDVASAAVGTVSSTASGSLDAASGMASDLVMAARRAAGFATDQEHSDRFRSSGRASSRPRPTVHGAARAESLEGPVGRWFADEVLGMTRRYPLLVATLGLSLGAAIGGSLRLTGAERGLAGPLSREVKKRALAMADERYGEFVETAEQLAGSLKSRLGAHPDGKDVSSDFETVLGGGPPPVEETRGAPHAGPPAAASVASAGGPA